jgi:hypothetical protein
MGARGEHEPAPERDEDRLRSTKADDEQRCGPDLGGVAGRERTVDQPAQDLGDAQCDRLARSAATIPSMMRGSADFANGKTRIRVRNVLIGGADS